MKLTHSRLLELLSYDRDTGIFTSNLVRQGGRPVGTEMGSVRQDGYVILNVEGMKVRAARLAWFYVTGTWPDRAIAHKNGDRADCRFDNLLLGGVMPGRKRIHLLPKGVYRKRGRYEAKIRGQNLGTFLTVEEAAEAVKIFG